MTDEIKNEEKECKCFCKSEGFRRFLTIALGTFVGVYAALSLFTAIHRPPMMPPCAGGFGRPVPVMAPCPFKQHRPHFDRGFERGEFHKNIKDHKGPAPFDANRDKN